MSRHPPLLIYLRRDAERYRDTLRQMGYEGEVWTATDPVTAEEYLGSVEVLLVSRIEPALLSRMVRLRWVQSVNAGVEALVHLRELPESVPLTRVEGAFGGMIAEHVFLELLADAKDLARLRRQQTERRWMPYAPGTLAGRVLGVAGLGSIGAEIVRKARAFDLTVYGLGRTGRGRDLVDRYFSQDEWIPFVEELDVLVLTLPHTQETEGVVGHEVFQAMKPSALLVNVGRGSLVVEEALIDALRAGRIRGAILDVFREEPLPPESPLWALPGVVISPHISGPSTPEAVGRYFLDNLERFLAGKPLRGLVDRRRGY